MFLQIFVHSEKKMSESIFNHFIHIRSKWSILQEDNIEDNIHVEKKKKIIAN